MIFALYDFTPFKNELPETNLKLLLNMEDLNYPAFNEIFNIIHPHQQKQYITFKESDKAKDYKIERNTKFPSVDFNSLPEILDEVLLQKLIIYKKDRDLRRVIHDLLSQEHKDQITKFESENRDDITPNTTKIVADSLEKKRNKRKFNGNMGEPANVIECIMMDGINPFTREPETFESFYEKYTLDPKTGIPVPKNT
ncbi:hypothetical protein [Chryseobacterium sp. EO14]|uniref:hypothetical protein n=1 Tax=Chryseobacterium sp. EO14 TaxID=2950551 RepID=UPI00210B29AF|nr:hypothetical protein [Chryseobacterium sp. EO14]MCQ4141561.1 hypothetical protein [Chryseobacterium sp. EO14]